VRRNALFCLGVRKSLTFLASFLFLTVDGLYPAPLRAAEKGGVFLLPVEGNWPVSESGATVFEERLTIALGNEGRVRAVGVSDVPSSKRDRLPKSLATCANPECVKSVSAIMGVDTVLRVRLANDNGQVTCFVTVYDGRNGGPLQRKEWPARYGDSGVPAELAGAIARWTRGEAPPPKAPVPAPAPAPKPTVLALGLGPRQADSPEARALLADLLGRLQGNGVFSVVRAPALAKAPATHQGIIVVDHLDMATRQHHVHHYREGQLQATLTITEVATGAVIFSLRGQAKTSVEAEHVTELQVLGTLVGQVLEQWLAAFDAQQVSEKLRKK
jgi:hypothetical protein